MKLSDIFKKKKKEGADKKGEAKKKEVKKPERKEAPLEPLEKEVKKAVSKGEEIKPIAKRRSVSDNAYKVLHSPHITEKATNFNEENKYVFKIWPKANNYEIKEAIKDIYGVDVVSVRIINVPRRKRRLGKHIGWRKGYKKAIVGVKKGQKIEILPR